MAGTGVDHDADPVLEYRRDSKQPFRLSPCNAGYNRAQECVGDATIFDVAPGERLLAV